MLRNVAIQQSSLVAPERRPVDPQLPTHAILPNTTHVGSIPTAVDHPLPFTDGVDDTSDEDSLDEDTLNDRDWEILHQAQAFPVDVYDDEYDAVPTPPAPPLTTNVYALLFWMLRNVAIQQSSLVAPERRPVDPQLPTHAILPNTTHVGSIPTAVDHPLPFTNGVDDTSDEDSLDEDTLNDRDWEILRQAQAFPVDVYDDEYDAIPTPPAPPLTTNAYALLFWMLRNVAIQQSSLVAPDRRPVDPQLPTHAILPNTTHVDSIPTAVDHPLPFTDGVDDTSDEDSLDEDTLNDRDWEILRQAQAFPVDVYDDEYDAVEMESVDQDPPTHHAPEFNATLSRYAVVPLWATLSSLLFRPNSEQESLRLSRTAQTLHSNALIKTNTDVLGLIVPLSQAWGTQVDRTVRLLVTWARCLDTVRRRPRRATHVVRRRIVRVRKVPRRIKISTLPEDYDLDDANFEELLEQVRLPSYMKEEYSDYEDTEEDYWIRNDYEQTPSLHSLLRSAPDVNAVASRSVESSFFSDSTIGWDDGWDFDDDSLCSQDFEILHQANEIVWEDFDSIDICNSDDEYENMWDSNWWNGEDDSELDESDHANHFPGEDANRMEERLEEHWGRHSKTERRKRRESFSSQWQSKNSSMPYKHLHAEQEETLLQYFKRPLTVKRSLFSLRRYVPFSGTNSAVEPVDATVVAREGTACDTKSLSTETPVGFLGKALDEHSSPLTQLPCRHESNSDPYTNQRAPIHSSCSRTHFGWMRPWSWSKFPHRHSLLTDIQTSKENDVTNIITGPKSSVTGALTEAAVVEPKFLQEVDCKLLRKPRKPWRISQLLGTWEWPALFRRSNKTTPDFAAAKKTYEEESSSINLQDGFLMRENELDEMNLGESAIREVNHASPLGPPPLPSKPSHSSVLRMEAF
jgi:hypothetical protein